MSEDPSSRRGSTGSFGSASGGYHHPALFEVGSLISYTYQVEALLARGGMGEVYKTRHTAIGTEHAIKIVRPHLAPRTEARRGGKECVITCRYWSWTDYQKNKNTPA